jgi:hypothetical protein
VENSRRKRWTQPQPLTSKNRQPPSFFGQVVDTYYAPKFTSLDCWKTTTFSSPAEQLSTIMYILWSLFHKPQWLWHYMGGVYLYVVTRMLLLSLVLTVPCIQDQEFVAFRDIRPSAQHHIQLIPKAHIGKL